VAVALLAATLAGPVPFAAQAPGQVVPADAAPPSAAYRLVAGDAIEVRHAFNPELNEVAQVRPDGRVSLPLVGEIQMAGRTVEEIVRGLEQQYAAEIRNPRIMLQVRSFAAQKVFVTGEVPRPGLINMPGQMTLFEALSEAGGIRTTGSRTVVLIRKGPDGTAVGRSVPAYVGGQLGPQASIPLQPFDVVIVPESRIARVDRWVNQYIRQLLPFDMTAGFTYLMQHRVDDTIIPIF
jgi:protein involved in polysaccharide export with SLBB domain